MELRSSFLLFVLVLELCWISTSGIKWLALMHSSSVATSITRDECNNLTGLVKQQKRLCKRHTDMMPSVQTGATLAMQECQWQFRLRRWNCSMMEGLSVFENALTQGTREAAFVHSVSAAGVAWEVTRACSIGSIDHCGCDETVRGRSPKGFEWAGCSDNIAYGSAFCRTFVDARERAKGSGANRALMNLHNNEAGRRVIEDNMKVQCKCHGVSGSCELKTCWRAMPTFREIGDVIKEKFDGATEVTQRRSGSRRVLKPKSKQYKPHTERDLVYLEVSPDFCDFDPNTGSLGTHGRLCNKSSKAIDGCDLMCCGRGYKTRRRIVVERCRCKFQWCCTVKCDQCKRQIEEYFCN